MLRIKFGNHKIPDSIGVINMGTSKACPSRLKGMCVTVNKGIKCYAAKAEDQYKEHVVNYREEQQKYWTTTSKENIAIDILKKVKGRRKPTEAIRLNEAGDFHTQDDVDKASYVAKQLKEHNIVVYGHTARRDLNFKKCAALIKGSGHTKANNGTTFVLEKEDPIPKGYIECPGSCKSCNLCRINVKHNIIFRRH